MKKTKTIILSFVIIIFMCIVLLDSFADLNKKSISSYYSLELDFNYTDEESYSKFNKKSDFLRYNKISFEPKYNDEFIQIIENNLQIEFSPKKNYLFDGFKCVPNIDEKFLKQNTQYYESIVTNKYSYIYGAVYYVPCYIEVVILEKKDVTEVYLLNFTGFTG